MQSSYVLLLNDKLKTLGHFADQVFQASSDYELFHTISTRWVPAAKRTPLLKPLRSLWDKNLHEYQQNWKKTEILDDPADIIHPNESDKKANPNAKPYINFFPFSSSISEIYNLKKKKSRDNFHDAWVVWENLCLAHWCWMYGENFFKRQELAYDLIAACVRSSFLLELHSVYCDMHAIKEKRKRPIGSSFFSQERFKNYLKLLMNHILLFQEEIAPEAKPENKIHALGLKLNQNVLCLCVEWVKDNEVCQYLLHNFQEKSAQLQILLPLFNKKEEKILSLSEHSSGNNSTKFLERIGLVKELKSIFVEKTSTNSVSFRGKYVELDSLSSINQPQLIQQIEELPLVR